MQPDGSFLTHHQIDVGDGLQLHAVVSGDGSPVVFLHGFTGSAETWEFARQQLGESYAVVAVDMPGHGRSSAPADPERYRLDRFVDDLAQVLDYLRLGKVAVVGYSMGGRAALRFALARPERVAALVLESTSSGIADAETRARRVKSDAALAETIEKQGIAAFVDHWESLPLWASQQNVGAERRSELRRQRLANDPRGLANSLRGAGAGMLPPVLDELANIRAHTLIIAGALDTAYTEAGRVLAAGIPGARLSVIPNAGHAIHFEAPDAFIDTVTGHLGEIPAWREPSP